MQYNRVWNQRLSSQSFHHDRVHGDVVHQRYDLPWPLKPRELVLRCHNDLQRGALRMTARCRSVHTDLVPVTSRAVRMEIQESVWRFEAMPAERTRITVEIAVSPQFAAGVPSFVTLALADGKHFEGPDGL